MACLKSCFVLLVIAFVCVEKSKAFRLQSRIVGGDAAELKQFPYQVSLHKREDQKYFCCGTILNERFIISAGHCFVSQLRSADRIYATVGHKDLMKREVQRLSIKKIHVHPDFDLLFTWNDISLIQTKMKIIFSETVQPINLPTEDTREGLTAIVSGFGQTFPLFFDMESHPSDELQYQETKLIDLDLCRSKFERRMFENQLEYLNVLMSINQDVICTINPVGEGACTGDSGGPLVENNTLIGIVSWSVECAEGHPDVYTRVYSHRNWIQTEQKAMLNSS